MKNPRYRTANVKMLAIGILLLVYLFALVAFTWLGQQRLREALLDRAQVTTERHAERIGFVLAGLRDSLQDASASKAIRTLLSNRNRGVSTGHSLRANLTTVAGEFRRLIEQEHIGGKTVFRRVSLIDDKGAVLVDQTAGPAIAPLSARPQAAGDPTPYIHADRSPWGLSLHIGAAVEVDRKVSGLVHAELVVERALPPALRDTRDRRGKGQIALVDKQDRVLASSGGDWQDWRKRAIDKRATWVDSPIKGTEWRIVDLTDDRIDHGIVTSPLFLAALALMGMPLLAGMGYIWRLNSHALVLRTRINTGKEKRRLLREQNELLQHEIGKRQVSEEKLAHQANFDQLTGLPNRNLALDRLSQAVMSAAPERHQVLVLFLDLDRFKQVNDSLGHAAGDELLREAAQRLTASVRRRDTVARLGGDEFLVICPDLAPDTEWEPLAQKLLKTLAKPFYIGEHEFFVGASVGVASYPEGGQEPMRLLKNADIAMYAAKENGRNNCRLYDPSMDVCATEQMKLERNLRHALQREELYLMFQPIVDLTSGHTVALEALLRWNCEEMGPVSPDRFIPIAEETGLIHEIGEWVLQEACRVVGELSLGPDFRIAVNLSSRQFANPNRLLECVLRALRTSGLMPNQLELEITESILIDDRPEIHELILQLDRIGVRLSIDDFGTGYSALNYLQRFPFDVLKIDQGFTRQVPGSKANASLIRAIIAMAHALDLEVIAEGIETREQAGFLLVYRCELGQGYLYSKPLSIADLHIHLDDVQRAQA